MSAQEVINGVNTSQLFDTIEAIKKTPNLADFKFTVNNEWLECGHNRSEVCNFYGAGDKQTREHKFVLDADEPPVLLGQDHGANPVEHLLHALASCVTTSLVYHAAAKGIKISEVSTELVGNLDLHGFLGMDDEVHRGYQDINIKFKIKADVSDEELEELCKLGPRFSPVFDTITRAVPVTFELAKD